MIHCKRIRSQFTDALYGELSDIRQQKFNTHLSDCDNCHREFEQLKATLNTMEQRTQRDPGTEFWENYWEQLQRELTSSEQTSKNMKFRKQINDWLGSFKIHPRPALQFAFAVAFIVLGIYIGKWIYAPSNRQIPIADHSVTEPDAQRVDTRTVRYLERSKLLLLGLVNFDASSDDLQGLNFQHQQKISRELIHEAKFLKQQNSGYLLSSLITDLEVILLQIANLESTNDINGIELIQSGIDRKAILLKINLEEIKGYQKTTKSKKNNRI